MFTIQSIHIAFELWGGIFCLIAAFCLGWGKGVEWEKRRFLMALEMAAALLLFSDAFAWGYRGSLGHSSYWIVKISNFLVFFTSDVILMLYHGWVCSYLFPKTGQGKQPKRVRAVHLIAVAGMVLVVLSQFTNLYYYFDMQNFYHRNTMYPLALLIPMLGMVVDLTLLWQYRKRLRKELFLAMCSYLFLPAVATVVLIFYYGISLINMSIALSAICMFVAEMIENSRILSRQQEELADMKIKIMVSQINPHFLLNALMAIQQLCETQPKAAEETVGDFARYLRGNLDALNCDGLIPFERELGHVKTYLSIEKKRFGERVKVVWKIAEEGFLLPPLTLQPIVENAVKHGITRKEQGGTVTIQTMREHNGILIRVMDDGVGFEEKNLESGTGEHIGIQNVTNRLVVMCGGTLHVHSIPGRGTTVEMYLPGEQT